MSWLNVLEWAGCALGILGAVLVAVKSRHAHWAWGLWLVSNLSWTAYGLGTGQMSIALQQGAFSLTSLLGLWHWVVCPRLEGLRAKRGSGESGGAGAAAAVAAA